MFAMNLKNRVVLGATNMHNYLGASRSLAGSASLAREECSQTMLFYRELRNVNIACHVLTFFPLFKLQSALEKLDLRFSPSILSFSVHFHFKKQCAVFGMF
ncbi:hypothetical protein P8452_12453 [Trifolium repens]|nr:hypothetical protein P8452_12453 [Trifolium repens]